MRSAKPIGFAEMNQSEMDVEGDVQELTLAGGAFRQADNTDVEKAANSLDTSLRRVSEASTREIESLVDEFHGLRKKLEADLGRIQRDIAEYTELSKGVMQLATTISDGVKKLPGAPGVTR
jgi:ATP phosphoribosyltransferase regulatory subunit HisZ